MTEALVTTGNRMPVFTMNDALVLAESFAKAKVMGATNNAEGMLVVTLIQEIGLVKAEATYHIMMGRISKKAGAMYASFIKAGGECRIVNRDENSAEVVVSFGKTRDATFKFTWEDAKKEPFVYRGKPNEQLAALEKPYEQRFLKAKYSTPRSRMQMLWARLVSDFCTALYPDACDGMYPPEAVSDFDELQSHPYAGKVIDIEDVQQRVASQLSPEICPIGDETVKGRHWVDITSDILLFAVKEDIDPKCKVIIESILTRRGVKL